MLMTQFFIIIGGVGVLCCSLSLIALHILPTGFHPIHDPVSDYAVSRYGFLYHIQAFSSGISGVCLMLWFTNSRISLPFLGIVALLCYSFSRILIVFFPTDVKPPRTFKGTIHVVLAVLSFAGIGLATVILTPSLKNLITISKLGLVLQVAALLTCISAFVSPILFVIRPLKPFIGLLERFIYLGTLLWLGIVFMQLLF
jgi:hypothetical protein